MRRSPLLAVALTGALVAGCTGGGEARVVGPVTRTALTTATGPSTTTPGGRAPLEWGACEPDPAVPVPLDDRLECATLTVPADPDDPSLGTFDLALVRLPATGEREGAVLFNPGGPGGSGWDLAAYSVASRSSRLDPELTGRFDLVGFDPRRVGRSDGVVCLDDAAKDAFVWVLFSLADSYTGRNPDGTWSNQDDANRVISCTSGFASRPPADPAQGLAILRAVAPRLAADVTVEQLADNPCDGLPVGPPPAPFSYRGDGPILLVGGAKDPVTPLAYAKSMAASLGERARLVGWNGEGHTAFLGSRCVDRLVADVLVRRQLPAPGTTCEPDPTVARPGWFDDLPAVPGATPLDLAGLEALLGFDPTELYAEFAAVADGVDAAAAAYEQAFDRTGWDLLGRDVIEVAPPMARRCSPSGPGAGW